MMSGEQQQLDRLQELADLYQEKYPNIVNDDDLALKFYAEGEATGHVVRTGNGIMIIACNGISYIDNNDPSKSWGGGLCSQKMIRIFITRLWRRF